MFSPLAPRDRLQLGGVFTPTPSVANHPCEAGLITFLATVQHFQVPFLPISWHDGLESLGEGGSAVVSQSIVSASRLLAFKRFRQTDDPSERFKSLMTEIATLSQPLVSRSPYIVDIEGVCWDVDVQTRDIAPVLVFEKAMWDVAEFMTTTEGKDLSLDQRLGLCVQIGEGLLALHTSGQLSHLLSDIHEITQMA